jgi:phosphinothricin acetyltransferase
VTPFGYVAEGAERGAGDWKLVSRVFPENAASRALCRSLGFREVGTYHRHARLDGHWRDCVIVEKLLGDATSDDAGSGTTGA